MTSHPEVDVSDTWGRNPYPAYTQQAEAWEREQARIKAEKDRQFRDNLAAVERENARLIEQNRGGATTVRRPDTGGRPRGPRDGTREGRGTAAVKGLTLLGGILGAGLAAGAGVSILVGFMVGGILGMLVIPVLELVGWVLATALKVAIYAVLALVALGVLAAIFGG